MKFNEKEITGTTKNKFCVYPIGLGAMPLSISGRPTEEESIEVIKTFLEAGGNFIDTANVYCLNDNERGHNEKLIHRALKTLGALDKTVVATKGGATRPQGGWGLGEGHPKQLRNQCEQSLKNLNIESHSLYYLHGPDPYIPLEDSIGELVRLKEEGKLKDIGIANVDLEQTKKVFALTPIAAVQNRCNLFCKEDFKNGLIEYCEKNNIAYVSYCPLGGWADHAKLALRPELSGFITKYPVSSYVISLSWLLSKSSNIIPIPGMDKKEQIAMNFQAINTFLYPDDILKMDKFPDFYSPKYEEKIV